MSLTLMRECGRPAKPPTDPFDYATLAWLLLSVGSVIVTFMASLVY